jgi:hypothetical protein
MSAPLSKPGAPGASPRTSPLMAMPPKPGKPQDRNRQAHHSAPRLCPLAGICKRIEEPFGWIKTVAPLRKTRHRGVARGGSMVTLAMVTLAMAAYDVIRIPKLLAAA